MTQLECRRATTCEQGETQVIDTFKGFGWDWRTSPYLAIVVFDGEVDIYGAESPDAEAEINRLYQLDYKRDPEEVRFYKQVTR